MFDNTTFSLASAVANGGTVTVSYPTGRSQGHYNWSPKKHVLFVDGNKYAAPADFTLTFNVNASSITLTNASGVTWPASADCTLQIDRAGVDDTLKLDYTADRLAGGIYRNTRLRQIMGRVCMINLGAPNVADADGFCASQDLTSAGVFSSSVTAAAAIAAAALAGVCDVPRNVVAAWTGTAVLTVTGTDEYGVTIVESSASGTSLTGKKAFKTVTGISTSANITSLTVGTGDVLGLPVAVQAVGQVMAEYKDGLYIPPQAGHVYLSGTILEAAVDAGTALNFVSPVAGRIAKVWTMCAGGVTTGGDFTVEVNTVAVDGLTVTVANSAAEGDMDSDTPTAEHATAVVAAGDRIEVIPGAAFNAAADFMIVIDIEATHATHGTFVAAVGTEATATTGDVRGTYDPVSTLNGAIDYMLMVMLPDPADRGITQYGG